MSERLVEENKINQELREKSEINFAGKVRRGLKRNAEILNFAGESGQLEKERRIRNKKLELAGKITQNEESELTMDWTVFVDSDRKREFWERIEEYEEIPIPQNPSEQSKL